MVGNGEWEGRVGNAKEGYGRIGEELRMVGNGRGEKDTVTFLMESTAVNVRSIICSKGHPIRER